MRPALACVLLLAACPSKPVGVGPAPEPAKSSTAPPATVVTGPRVLVSNLPTPGAVEIVARAPVSLDSKLYVEHQMKDGSWEPLLGLDVGSMRLVETCEEKIGACISLSANRILRPVAWSGMSCSAQCNGSCDKNVYRAGMPHRFFVKTCDGGERFEGLPFDLPAK